jgi:nucleotide-binding universal stress UspA family protein
MTPRILMAFDGSSPAGQAIVRAVEWFPADSEFHAVYVHGTGETIRIPVAIPPHAATGGLDPEPGLERRIEKQEREFVEKKIRDLTEEHGVQIRLHWRRGDPRHEIVQAATDLGADVVVIGSRGHGRISRLLLGSVSSFVVEHAPVSTLVVR